MLSLVQIIFSPNFDYRNTSIKKYTFSKLFTSFPIMTSNKQNSNFKLIEGTNYAFYIHKKLGEGFGGSIYEGVNIINSSSVAVKIIKIGQNLQNQITYSEMIKLTSEQSCKQKQSQFSKNWIVKIIDVIQLDKTFVIMQLCEYNLKEYLYHLKQRKSQDQILKVFKNIVEALLCLGKKGYHFCDLKPENILITRQGNAKIGDLESLIRLNQLNHKKKSNFHDQIFGTLHYMPPQLLQLGQYHQKNYIWSLGIILHQIIYGQAPFKNEKDQKQCNQQQKQNHYSSFYKKLFNLEIKTHLNKIYPKSHQLLKDMLRFNHKRRISLENLHQLLQYSKNYSFYNQLKFPREFLKKRQRSNSQLTNDSQDINLSSPESSFSAQVNQPRKLSYEFLEQSHQNSKLKQDIENKTGILRLNLHKQCIESQNIENAQFIKLFEQTIQYKVFPSIEKIKGPVILVKKLNDLRENINHLVNKIKNSKQTNESQFLIQHLIEKIKSSKAYSHLQKTVKLTSTENDRKIYQKQLTLWQDLNSTINLMNQRTINQMNNSNHFFVKISSVSEPKIKILQE